MATPATSVSTDSAVKTEYTLPPSEAIPTCKVILANTIAKGILSEVHEGLKNLKFQPRLLGLLANNDPAAITYAQYTEKTMKENGFDFTLRTLNKEDIEDEILEANADPLVHGIIVYYPIFPANAQREKYIQQLVSIDKDVEGLCHRYVFNMYQNIRYMDPPKNQQKSILPCTPLAVVKVLEYLHIYNPIIAYGNRLFGKRITVINRSEVVGRPLAALLANDGAQVYSVDITGVQLYSRGTGIRKTKHEVEDMPNMGLTECLALSDVVISGVPGDKFKVDMNHVRHGAVCINFSSERNFDNVAVKGKASIYVPAIGKVTIAVLLRNLMRLVHNSQEKGLIDGNHMISV